MKKQLLKIFHETCVTKNSSPPVNVKVEDAFYSNSFRGRTFYIFLYIFFIFYIFFIYIFYIFPFLYHRRGHLGCGEAPGRRYANQFVQQSRGEQPQNSL